MGDIHGAYKALVQCLQEVNFDYENDTLIQLGDVVDGWSETYECVEELLKIKNLIAIRGNHDEWLEYFIETGRHGGKWEHGGFATMTSYFNRVKDDVNYHKQFINNNFTLPQHLFKVEYIPQTHQNFFKNQVDYYIDSENRMFCHAGFNRHYHVKDQQSFIFYWDRDLWGAALGFGLITTPINEKVEFRTKDNFKEIFIGHTPTVNYDLDVPMQGANIINIDTGAGWRGGKLTIMEVDTKAIYQSDYVHTLYPNEKGRRK